MAAQAKVHIALNVSDVSRSAKFYRAMFGVDPVKLKPGYAKFDLSEPPLNLSLNEAHDLNNHGALNHLGIEVSTSAEVLAARDRLQKAGLATFDEMNVDCCYALQDKTWITDPDGNRWEVFTVKIPDTALELQTAHHKQKSRPVCCAS